MILLVIATNEFGSAATQAILTITSKPSLVAGLEDQEVIEGSPVEFEVKAEGFPSPDFKWYLNGEEMKPDGLHVKVFDKPGTSKLVIDKAGPKDAGDYRVIASNDSGSAPSMAALKVTKKLEKPKFVVGLDDVQAELGTPLKLEVKVFGTPSPKLTWLKNGDQIYPKSGLIKITEYPDGTAVLTITGLTPADQGDYKVIAKNEAGETATKGNFQSIKLKSISNQ